MAVDRLVGMRVSVQQERHGLDFSMHREKAQQSRALPGIVEGEEEGEGEDEEDVTPTRGGSASGPKSSAGHKTPTVNSPVPDDHTPQVRS